MLHMCIIQIFPIHNTKYHLRLSSHINIKTARSFNNYRQIKIITTAYHKERKKERIYS